MRHRVRGVAAALALTVAVLITGCSSGGNGTGTTPTSTASGSSASGVVWLCLPGMTSDPCKPGLSTTTYSPKDKKTGTTHPTTTASPRPACFYAYPTVSSEKRKYSDRRIQASERRIAAEQAGRWSQVCDVYAPVYRQATLSQIAPLDNPATTAATIVRPAKDLTAAFEQFLTMIPADQPFMIIAHSQGATVMRDVLAKSVDRHPAIRDRMLSAMLLGGNVLVKTGTVSGGDFKYMPGCTSEKQTGCIIAFSTFGEVPPDGTDLGVTAIPGMSVLCTDPAKLDGTGKASPIYAAYQNGPQDTYSGMPSTKSDWQSVPGQYTARCYHGDSDALVLSSRKGSVLPDAVPNTLSGLHDLDANMTLGNLLRIFRVEDAAWQAKH